MSSAKTTPVSPTEETIREAIANADALGKGFGDVLRKLYGIPTEQKQQPDNRPVTERIKTFEDACDALGIDAFTEEEKYEGLMSDEVAYQKLRIICAALNEGWQPKFSQDEWRWYPWHWLYTDEEMSDMSDDEKAESQMMTTGDYVTDYAGFAFANSSNAPSLTNTYIGSRLCLKSEALADYCGKQFIRLWADFKLISRG